MGVGEALVNLVSILKGTSPPVAKLHLQDPKPVEVQDSGWDRHIVGILWASRIVLVPNPGGDVRMCTHNQKLNKITEIDMYLSLPWVEKILGEASASKVHNHP